MLNRGITRSQSSSLMGDYAALLGEAVLRHRTRTAEHAARIEAELANKVKSEFLSNMSHELRTPLNTVMGFSKLMTEHGRRRLGDDDIVEYAQLIHDAASHLLAVINDILDISKIQSGKYALDAKEVLLDEVLSSCIATLKPTSDETGVALVPHIAFDLPAIRGESAKLRQVFMNIISNAIKFTHRGGTVKVEASKRANGSVAVVVRDTGVGMSEDEIRIALTPFGQVDGARSRWREGTGLGLSIAKALIELHGGDLGILSAKGQGTQVTVTLPSRNQVSIAEAREAVFGHGTST